MDRPKPNVGRGGKGKTPQFPSDLYILGPKGARNESIEAKRPIPVPSKPSTSHNIPGTKIISTE